MTTRAVNAPDPGFAGARAGVVFRDGRGEVDADDAAALAYFERHGYAVDTTSPPTKREPRGRAAAAPARDDAVNPTTEGEPPDA
jgi:hypothetical protein